MNDLNRLGRRIADEQDAVRARETSGRFRVRERLASLPAPSARSTRYKLWVAAAGVSIAATMTFALWARFIDTEPLRAMIGSSQKRAAEGDWIEAPRVESLPVRFSNGTSIDMAPRSRARLLELGSKGAHVLIESGRVDVKVVRRPDAGLKLSVGPFRIRVTGTRFNVRWNPDLDEFKLELAEGNLEVSGCVFGQGYRMKAGQRVYASCKSGRFDMMEGGRRGGEEIAMQESVDANAASKPQASLPEASRPAIKRKGRGPARQVFTSAQRRALTWRKLAEQGSYVQAFMSAEAAGFESQCAQANATELWMLADAAHFAGAAKKEAHALILLRNRFPKTSLAALAAYSLGRLEFDNRGSYGKSARWFEVYLEEQPGGSLSREARGRLIEAISRAGDVARARALAAEYLRDYPSGPHAELAKNLLETAEP
ncbi:MAG: FecR domain-containing protein [Deltaproteobacteria bacterium]|nr:FecR domain-containing protein [Deltaproteobacteria bacterium]